MSISTCVYNYISKYVNININIYIYICVCLFAFAYTYCPSLGVRVNMRYRVAGILYIIGCTPKPGPFCRPLFVVAVISGALTREARQTRSLNNFEDDSSGLLWAVTSSIPTKPYSNRVRFAHYLPFDCLQQFDPAWSSS